MHMLYDSEAYVVVYINAAEANEDNLHNLGKPERSVFEIVDKEANMTLCLDGAWAAAFQAQMDLWKVDTPGQEDVEEVLNLYAKLANYPLVIH
jgi:hypothetical protein